MARKGDFEASFKCLGNCWLTGQLSECDSRVVRAFGEYAHALAALGISRKTHVFKLMEDFVDSLLNRGDLKGDADKLTVVLQLSFRLGCGRLVQRARQALSVVLLKAADGPGQFRNRVGKWNRALMEDRLFEEVGCDLGFAGKCKLLRQYSDDFDWYRLAKFNLAINQSDLMNWLSMAKVLLRKSRPALAEFV